MRNEPFVYSRNHEKNELKSKPFVIYFINKTSRITDIRKPDGPTSKEPTIDYSLKK